MCTRTLPVHVLLLGGVCVCLQEVADKVIAWVQQQVDAQPRGSLTA